MKKSCPGRRITRAWPKFSTFFSLVPRPVRAIRVNRGGLEPSAIARGRPGRIFPTSFTGDVTSEIAEDDWERGWAESGFTAKIQALTNVGFLFTPPFTEISGIACHFY